MDYHTPQSFVFSDSFRRSSRISTSTLATRQGNVLLDVTRRALPKKDRSESNDSDIPPRLTARSHLSSAWQTAEHRSRKATALSGALSWRASRVPMRPPEGTFAANMGGLIMMAAEDVRRARSGPLAGDPAGLAGFARRSLYEALVFSEEEAVLSEISEGTILVCVNDAVVFDSMDSWETIEEIRVEETVVVAGSPKMVDGYAMVNIHPHGAVELECFKPKIYLERLLELENERIQAEHERFLTERKTQGFDVEVIPPESWRKSRKTVKSVTFQNERLSMAAVMADTSCDLTTLGASGCSSPTAASEELNILSLRRDEAQDRQSLQSLCERATIADERNADSQSELSSLNMGDPSRGVREADLLEQLATLPSGAPRSSIVTVPVARDRSETGEGPKVTARSAAPSASRLSYKSLASSLTERSLNRAQTLDAAALSWDMIRIAAELTVEDALARALDLLAEQPLPLPGEAERRVAEWRRAATHAEPLAVAKSKMAMDVGLEQNSPSDFTSASRAAAPKPQQSQARQATAPAAAGVLEQMRPVEKPAATDQVLPEPGGGRAQVPEATQPRPAAKRLEPAPATQCWCWSWCRAA